MIMVVVMAVLAVFAGRKRLGATDHQRAAHEVLAVEIGHGLLGVFNGHHGHKGEALAALGAVVHHHFRVLHLAGAVEEFEEITLRGVIAEIADVKALAGHFGRDWGLAGFALFTARLAVTTSTLTVAAVAVTITFAIVRRPQNRVPAGCGWVAGRRRLC